MTIAAMAPGWIFLRTHHWRGRGHHRRYECWRCHGCGQIVHIRMVATRGRRDELELSGEHLP